MKENILLKTIAKITAAWLIVLLISTNGYSQKEFSPKPVTKSSPKNKRFFYGLASFYSDKFHGRRTANGEIFRQDKYTAACNVLPLGTWIRVTNLKNNKSVVVKTSDRLHTRMRRLVDLSRIAAKKLGYIDAGLTRVKIEVLNQQQYK